MTPRPRDLSRAEEWDRRDRHRGPELYRCTCGAWHEVGFACKTRVVGGRRVDLACVVCGGVSSSSLCDRCAHWNEYQSEYR